MVLNIVLHIALLLIVPPLMLGVINRTKSIFAGRVGPPILQPYFDVIRLLRKGAVYSRTTTWVFYFGPMVSLAAALCAGMLIPMVSATSPLGFTGDIILFAYLLGLGRFFTMAAALDTGSAFEGMGASREAAFSAFVEPALFMTLAIICIKANSVAFGGVFGNLPWSSWGFGHPIYIAVAVVLFIIILTENSRIPVDDPNTHLELTMIHEVMVLDHSGPDFAYIMYGAAVKLFVMGSLLLHILIPIPAAGGFVGAAMLLGGEIVLAVLIGVVESVMARLRLPMVPQFIMGASVLALLGLAVLFARGVS
jgi:formate hydrogenlyase subunit 4